ncbi:hypothetical protein VB566_04775 [Clostridium perfringens]|uniref:hypothetical protein n=1 Tax=Clostridium perfringens TaxID=1502 RepID=UPI001A21EB6E|nr:hypothetical protein [Clostridium perfringens]MEA5271942.1 hypothetical protein [Clostridium perfringens]MEA5310206.1 hypothetical protein [Clostridium perfringens]MEA5342398.1 hypothetical protein [Clostridium perfringens]HAT4203367.1 hypothetical protein [Clostridium perfringens]
MANNLQYSTIFQNELDKMAVQEMVTGWMDGNAGKVKYKGGKEVKIPKLSVDGLADYGRTGNSGFVDGDVTFGYETKTMTQDRGRAFSIDANDVDETGFVVTAGAIMGEFQRTKVIPEIDAYRLSALSTLALEDNKKYSYTPVKDTIIQEIKLGIKKIRQQGYNDPLVIHITYDALMEVELAMLGKISSVEFSRGGVNTKVPAIDGCPLIETPENRMYSAIQLYDGKTHGQTQGGYAKATKGIQMNFIIMAKGTPLAITKQDNMRIFDPQTNQKANAWAMDYRRYHDLWIKDNSANSIYVNYKEAKSE